MHKGNIEEIPQIIKKHDFALYGSWEALEMCKILLQGLGMVSITGKPIPVSRILAPGPWILENNVFDVFR